MEARLLDIEDRLVLFQSLVSDLLSTVRQLRSEQSGSSVPLPTQSPAAFQEDLSEPEVEREASPAPPPTFASPASCERAGSDPAIPRVTRFYTVISAAPGRAVGVYSDYRDFCDAIRDRSVDWRNVTKVPWARNTHGKRFDSYRRAEAYWLEHFPGQLAPLHTCDGR